MYLFIQKSYAQYIKWQNKKEQEGTKKKQKGQNPCKWKLCYFCGNYCSRNNFPNNSFDKLLCDVKPTIWMMQETKRNMISPNMRANYLGNYQIFELRRQKTKEEGCKSMSGGGLSSFCSP